MLRGAIICDLDGVLFRGDQPIPGAGEALVGLEESGFQILFCSNNSTRPLPEMTDRIRQIGQYPATTNQVVSSAQATASYLAKTRPLTYVCGGEGINSALQTEDIPTTTEIEAAQTIVVGLNRDFSYGLLDRLGRALRGGAELIATNTDPTFPTASGLAPGCGAMVAALEVVGAKPATIMGKPHPPMRQLLRQMLQVTYPVWAVGDRLDTDMALGWAEGWHTGLVLSGVTTGPDLEFPTPDLIAADLCALLPMILDITADAQ